MKLETFPVAGGWEMQVQEVYIPDQLHRLKQAYQTGWPEKIFERDAQKSKIVNEGDNDDKGSILRACVDR